MAGGFGEADISWDRGVKDFFFEVFLDFDEDLFGEGGAFVGHGGEDAEELEVGVHGFFEEGDGFEQLADAFEGVEFGLDGENEVVGGDEGVDSEEGERGRAVDNNIVIVGADFVDDFFKLGEFLVGFVEFDFGVGELGDGGGEDEAFIFGGDEDFLDGGGAGEDFDHGFLEGGFVDAEAAGGVALGVKIEEEGLLACPGEEISEVDTGGRLADAAFLVGDCDYLRHKNVNA